MIGIICLAPVISATRGPVIFPLFNLIHSDPAVLATILASDMSGYSLATRLAQDSYAGLFAELIVTSLLGMDATGAPGIVITLANRFPVNKLMKDMNPKGKVTNVAWLVSATAALGTTWDSPREWEWI
jgi:ethanolamine transporter EutH